MQLLVLEQNYIIGHQDVRVRRCLLELVVPLCNHSYLSNDAAMLILSKYLEDEEEELRLAFSKLIGYDNVMIVKCKASL